MRTSGIDVDVEIGLGRQGMIVNYKSLTNFKTNTVV